jgi:hypothetical protein
MTQRYHKQCAGQGFNSLLRHQLFPAFAERSAAALARQPVGQFWNPLLSIVADNVEMAVRLLPLVLTVELPPLSKLGAVPTA